MTEDLTPRKGRVFIGPVTKGGPPKLLVVKAARTNRAGRHTSCILVSEEPGVGGRPLFAEYSLTLPRDGLLHGYRRVTLARVGVAIGIAKDVGTAIPTDAVVVVTNDRVGVSVQTFDT